MSVTNPGSEIEALVYVVDRLQERFPIFEEEVIRALVVEATMSFDDAALRVHIPVLVEGAVRRRLRALTGGHGVVDA